MLSSSEINPAERVSARLANCIEQRIADGTYPIGTRIPQTRDLVRDFGICTASVQEGLNSLAERGLIERIPHRGTFVRKGFRNRTFGIIFGCEIYRNLNRFAYANLLNLIHQELDKRGWRVRLFPTTEKACYDDALRELRSAAESGQVNFVMEMDSNPVVWDYLEHSCPVPAHPSPAILDREEMAEQGIRHLIRHGAKHILIVGEKSIRQEKRWNRHFIYPEQLFPEKRVRLLQKEFPSVELDLHLYLRTVHFSEDVFRAVRRLFRKRKYDSLLILDDGLFRTLSFLPQAEGLSVPGDLRIITHSNKGVDLFWPEPLTRLEADPAEIARQLVEADLSLLEGKDYFFRPLRCRLIPGVTAGEKRQER